jgi:hypothetical protein
MNYLAHIDKNRFFLGIHSLDTTNIAVISSSISITKEVACELIALRNTGFRVMFDENDCLLVIPFADKDVIWQQIRADRSVLLAEADYAINVLFDNEKITGISTDPDVLDDFCAYRKALRDITTQSNPENIVWPAKPF